MEEKKSLSQNCEYWLQRALGDKSRPLDNLSTYGKKVIALVSSRMLSVQLGTDCRQQVSEMGSCVEKKSNFVADSRMGFSYEMILPFPAH